ncbi:hypothetical protein HNP37_003381 [Flavobacterium nitrogenifigens]|uniref:Uncharacterized protein n=2 Tax=Flavobacterium TaxID=237 RepID=A0A7W7IZ85_9FLAO|nr:hypothetical protein [Flavobacterium nitrogenifigens]MBB6388264.1 hypothetical protein [Flavobacterium notoginsengisoli]
MNFDEKNSDNLPKYSLKQRILVIFIVKMRLATLF